MVEPANGVLVVSPGGEGGVASAVRAVLPELPEVRWMPVGRGIGDRLGWGRAIAARRAAWDAEVVHVHPSFRWRALPRDLAVASGSRGGRVIHLHGYDERWLDRFARSRTWSHALRRALGDAVVASASSRLASALGGLGIGAEVVPNAVRLADLPAHRHPAPDEVLFLGRLAPGKGAELLVEAARGADFVVTIAGTGPLATALRARAPANVRFVGWADAEARAALLARATLLALPSEGEASPVAVVEALACGLPVVASPVGDVAELVGDAGVLVSDRDPAAWRRALTHALASPPPTAVVQAATRERVDPAQVAARWRTLHAAARQERRREARIWR
ncbi:MAG: glycosyltransferase family 4 protein [Alphaproteobacteria bacterium]|nr:glycosyltransferase family 4 protein [Alphaproteobacteria bacterium]MCB9697327.1 glycosyltransferase family 4 protein [Alphaproteobacteria bacterium]